MNPHADRREANRPAQHAVLKQKHRHRLRFSRAVQHYCAQLIHGPHQLRRQRAHRLNFLHLRMQSGGALKRQLLGRFLALRAQHNQLAFAARGQKRLHRRGLLGVALVGAALVAGRKAHLHLGVDTARMAGVRRKLIHATPQQKQLQRLLGKALRGCAAGKRPVGPRGLTLAGLVGHRDARIRIAAQIAHKRRRAQMHPLQRFCAVDLFQKRKLREQRLELRTG